MAILFTVVAAFSCCAWLYLIFFHGDFWRADQRLQSEAADARLPSIVAVVPARNEADVIQRSIGALIAQDYPLSIPIILVNDHSSDGTVDNAVSAAIGTGAGDRLIVVDAEAMPPGWVGKVWAMKQGVDRAASISPGTRYILFCDADIVLDPTCLRQLVAHAERGEYDLVSLMVLLSTAGFWERLLIPPFVFFFQMLYPFARVNDAHSRTAAAAGGCMLVRCSALRAAGGLEIIKGALIDDCALARGIAKSNGKLWLGLTANARSVRPYAGFRGVWHMVTRSAYTQLDHSPIQLMLCVFGMILVYGVPVGFAIAPTASAVVLAFLAYAMMCMAYYPTIRLYRQPAPAVLLLPVAAMIYTAMTICSAWRHFRGQGSDWKGRVYSS